VPLPPSQLAASPMPNFGTLEIEWVESDSTQVFNQITLDAARQYILDARKQNPRHTIKGAWVDENNEEITLNTQWEDDDFSDWEDDEDDALIGEAGEAASG